MLLKFGQKDVLCEDIFENMIIFPEAHWVGTREENPTEKELPMPAELQSAVKHEKYSFGSEVNQTGTATQPSQTQPSQLQAEGEDEVSSSSDDDLDQDEAGPSQPTRISSRHKGKRPLYTEPNNSGSDAEAIDLQDNDSVGEEAARKLPKLSQQADSSLKAEKAQSSGLLEDLSQPKAKAKFAKKPGSAAKTGAKATAKKGVVASSSDEDEEDAAPVPAAKKGGSARKQPTLSAFLSQSDSDRKGSNSKLTSAKGRSASTKGKKNNGEVIDLIDDDPGMASQDLQGSPLPVSPLRVMLAGLLLVANQPPRRVSKANSLRKFTVSCEDEDKESQGSSDVEIQSADEDNDDEDFEA
ncbi:MAG: DNA-binding RHL1 [Trebouxia sp. A1-2]|nr:MAG: DNA-binding RHL1 [Trebouxia sp. A1-2]